MGNCTSISIIQHPGVHIVTAKRKNSLVQMRLATNSFIPSIFVEKYTRQWNPMEPINPNSIREELLEKSLQKVMKKYNLDTTTTVSIAAPQYETIQLQALGFSATAYKKLHNVMEVSAQDLLHALQGGVRI
jgi:hypothetical protein